jgi:hypothetical protein
LRVQLVAKKIINTSDWDIIVENSKIKFAEDNYFSELKDAEIIMSRVNTVNSMQELIGVYYSKEWVAKRVLKLSDEDMKEINKQIKDNPTKVEVYE